MLVNQSPRLHQRRDIGCRLLEQLQEYLGPGCRIVEGCQKPWASITFTGTRYRFEMSHCNNEDIQTVQSRLDDLTEHEFVLPGQFVADILVQQKEPDCPSYAIDILAIADPVREPVSNMVDIG